MLYTSDCKQKVSVVAVYNFIAKRRTFLLLQVSWSSIPYVSQLWISPKKKKMLVVMGETARAYPAASFPEEDDASNETSMVSKLAKNRAR